MTFSQKAFGSYPFATWLMALTGVLLMWMLTGIPPDWSMALVVLAAPFYVPLFLAWGTANLVSFGLAQNAVHWAWVCFAACWVICFHLIGAWERRRKRRES